MMLDVAALQRVAECRMDALPALHKYQWEGVSFLFGSPAALLADEMGLGKTVQAVVALSLLLGERNGIDRALIVAPASLTLNWMTELAAWAPSVTSRRVQGDVADRVAFYMLPIPVLVSSYEQVREDGLERIPRDAFDVVVLDEAQRIKNPDSATTLACRLLPRKRAWALSATPLENNFDDLVSILDFLDPEIGRRLTRAEVTRKLEVMMLRRRKRDVRAELPAVMIQDLRLDLAGRQRERYEELWATREAYLPRERNGGDPAAVMLSLITRLKVLCNFDPESGESTKLEALKTISEGAGDSARIIVFSQFVETLRWISDGLDMPHRLLIGSMSQEKRQAVMQEFRQDKPPRALLISLRAGGVGLNLGEASHVVLFDRWWNPAAEVQAMYRAHRFDRDEPLHVVRFLVRNSIEERIVSILEKKEALFTDVIESAPTSRDAFSHGELMEILRLARGDE